MRSGNGSLRSRINGLGQRKWRPLGTELERGPILSDVRAQTRIVNRIRNAKMPSEAAAPNHVVNAHFRLVRRTSRKLVDQCPVGTCYRIGKRTRCKGRWQFPRKISACEKLIQCGHRELILLVRDQPRGTSAPPRLHPALGRVAMVSGLPLPAVVRWW